MTAEKQQKNVSLVGEMVNSEYYSYIGHSNKQDKHYSYLSQLEVI